MNQIAVVEKHKSLANLLDARKSSIAQALPKHLNVERLIRVCLSAASRNPMLLECTQESLLKSIIVSSQLGIEPDGVLGMGHLVPFKNNKTQKMEATFILGYRGCLDLARRGGDVQTIESGVVHEKDFFEIEFGLERKLKHIPAWHLDDSGKTIAAYAVATLKDGTKQIEVMSRSQIDGIRSRSKAGNYGPWVSDYDEMARKTVIKRIAKTLPISIEFSSAVSEDDAREFSPDISIENFESKSIDTDVVDKSSKLSEELQKKTRVKPVDNVQKKDVEKHSYPQVEKPSQTHAKIVDSDNEIPWPAAEHEEQQPIKTVVSESVGAQRVQEQLKNNNEKTKIDNDNQKAIPMPQTTKEPAKPSRFTANFSKSEDGKAAYEKIDDFLAEKHGELSAVTRAGLTELRKRRLDNSDLYLIVQAVRLAQAGKHDDLNALIKARQ